MTKLELEMTNNELNAKVIELQTELEFSRKTADDLRVEVANQESIIDEQDTERIEREREVEELKVPVELMCLRCYSIFWGVVGSRYCSYDCEHFRKQEKFTTLWNRLHPNGQREPDRVVAAHA